jgi:hypothetical protein
VLGRDPQTGIALESARWALRTVFAARPPVVTEDFAHWLNTVAMLADCVIAAGGTDAELKEYEGNGFVWGTLPAQSGRLGRIRT